MIVYPAMDLMGGKVVRLRQGRFDEVTIYAEDPVAALRGFAEAGATWVHVVDLDGARKHEPRQHLLIARLAQSVGIKIQAGGGFRTREHVAAALEAGIDRVVLGSIAVQSPDTVNLWAEEFGAQRLCLSLDIRIASRIPIVKTGGWLQDSCTSLYDVAERLPTILDLLITDIGRDGMMTGPNLGLYREARERLPNLRIQASGGIRSIDDLKDLETDGAIIGRALWEGRVKLEEALSLART